MPVKYIPYVPDTVEGQAILDNITRTRRVLRYRDHDAVYRDIRRGLPLYEVTETETVGAAPPPQVWGAGLGTEGAGTDQPSPPSGTAPVTPPNSGSPELGRGGLLLRGECLSACAYLKDQGVTLDLVYIDPPFASGADYAKSVYLRRHPHKAQEVAQAESELELDELRAFEEKMYGDIWNKEDYLNWMFENLTAIKSVMSEAASIYVHLDQHIGHYVKVMLDEVFGEDSFVNEIVWKRQTAKGDGTQGARHMGRIHETIFLYTKSSENYTWNIVHTPYDESYIEAFYRNADPDGRRYQLSDTSAPGQAGKGNPYYEFLGVKRYYRFSEEKMQTLYEQGKIVQTAPGTVPRQKRYLDEMPGIPLQSLWMDIQPVQAQAEERLDYATQKPEALLERIIKTSSDKGMLVADFFGGSGVTAKVAHDLGRRFIHVDVGVNSLQTTRDRLKAAGASFQVLDIQDGVSLFRNPIQTMDKLKTLIVGLKNGDGLDEFWEGAIQDSKLGLVPVYLPNLLDHQTKVLDVPLINRVIQEALPELPDEIKQVILYYVDIYDRPGVEKFLKEHNMTGKEVELRDLKEVLDEVVLNDEVEYEVREEGGTYEVEITRFASDRLQQKIDEYNQKKGLTGLAKNSLTLMESEPDEAEEGRPPRPNSGEPEAEERAGAFRSGTPELGRGGLPFKPIQISDDGLELIEWVSLDCTSAEGPWQADAEIKIDKKSFVIRDSRKTKTFWDAKITSAKRPLRLRVRNIAGDESILTL